MAELSQEQQRILAAIRKYGHVRRFTDWRTGRTNITTGRGHSFDVRAFNGLVKRGLIGPDPEDARLSHTETNFIELGDV